MIINIPEHIEKILNRYHQNGYEAFCVGGSIRDGIMGKVPYDWDIATSCFPEKTKELFPDYKIVDTGIRHGTVSLIVDKKCIEVTVFRTDGEYSDNRHPETVEFKNNIEDDLSRRDFTVNAIAYNNEKGFVDPFCGKADIKNKIIRTVGEPDKRFKEDGLRLMRALRFSSVLGFCIEENTKKSIHKNKELLNNISKERINAELTKLLMGENVFSVLMEYSDVFSVIIPEIAPAVGFKQYGEKHAYDVWEHICHTVATVPADRILRLTMLLHDLGKVPTHKLNEKGESTFKNHALVGGETAKKILTDLKFDKKTVNRVSFLISHHDFEPPETKTALKMQLKALTPEDVRTLLIIKKSDRGALSEPYRDISEKSERVLNWLTETEENNECTRVSQLNISGADLIKNGFSGKNVGEALERLLDAVISGEISNTKNELLTYIL